MVNKLQDLTRRLPRGIDPQRLLAGTVFAFLLLVWVYMVPNYYVFIGTSAVILAIAAMGLTVLVGWAGEVSLAQAGLVGTVVYLSAYAVRSDGWQWPYLAGAAFGLSIGILFSILVALPTVKLSGMYVMIITLSLQIALERIFFGNVKLSGGGQVREVPRPDMFGISINSDKAFYFFCLVALAGVLFFLHRFRTSRHGRAMMLVRTDRRAAAGMGINPNRYKLLAFVIAGGLAGVAGLLFVPLYRSPPTLYQFQAFASLFYLAIPVVAGFESLMAVVTVAFAFTIIPVALESLKISPFIVGGTALIVGTVGIGSRGVGGAVLDLIRSRRVNRALEAYAASIADRGEAPPVTETSLLAADGAGHVDLTSGGLARFLPDEELDRSTEREGSR